MITRKDVEHIAHLARIELTDEEKIKFGKELSAILNFIDQLNQVSTEGVEPVSGGTSLKNRSRRDEQRDNDREGNPTTLIAQAPETSDNWIKVRAVFQ